MFYDANSVSYEQYTQGVAPIVSLSAKSAASSVGVVLDRVVVRANATMAVTSSAGVSGGSVQLLGSLDGNGWFNLGSAVTTSSASTTTSVVVTNAMTRFVKASIASTITGGSVTVSIGLNS